MLAAGCRSSASAKGTCRRSASAAPTVDLPQPETPIATIGDGIEVCRPVIESKPLSPKRSEKARRASLVGSRLADQREALPCHPPLGVRVVLDPALAVE